ncbi:MAG: hypothetical protein NT178_07220 [Proteobacteria bacterium]|nr:hypothetical protein [Pseudomonadota bacterium]
MRKVFLIFITFCIFLGFDSIANADFKTICLHNKGGYIAKLLVYNGSSTSYTQVFETGDVTAGFTKCVPSLNPQAIPSIQIVIHEVGQGTLCSTSELSLNSISDNVTITTKGTIFSASCEGLP